MATERDNLSDNHYKPDHFTQISFYINLVISSYLLICNVLTLIALNFTELVEKFKQVKASEMIDRRGLELGFQPGVIRYALNQYYVSSLFLFLPIGLGLFLLWRKRLAFYPILTFGVFLQFFSMLILLGPRFIMEDISLIEKLLWFILIALSTLHWFLFKKEKPEASQFL